MTNIFNYDNKTLTQMARDHKFIKDNVEKMIRLSFILRQINESERLRDWLVLKGGTAINLVSFGSMPRISVDLDFDLTYNVDKDSMIAQRAVINDELAKILKGQGYQISYRSTFALDSVMLGYKTASAGTDKIKLDINYHNRCHLYDPVESVIPFPFDERQPPLTVRHLSNVELFAGKIKAFYDRCKPRDVYDVYSLSKSDVLKSEAERQLLRKTVYFYGTLGNVDNQPIFSNDASHINDVPFNAIKTQLLPMLHINSGPYPKDEICRCVIDYIAKLMIPDEQDLKYWNDFNNGIFNPHLLFDKPVADRLISHPVALKVLQDKIMNDALARIDNPVIYTDPKGNPCVRCKVDGHWQLGVQITPVDKRLYEDGRLSDKIVALKYYIDSMGVDNQEKIAHRFKW